MRLRNQRSLARPEQIDRPVIWRLLAVLWLSIIFLAGCAGGTSGTSRFSNFFGGASPAPGPTVAEVPTAAPTPEATPAAEEAPDRNAKKNAKQARAASENAAIASKDAADASAAAARASKQAASVANRIGGSGPTSADVSLESNSASVAAGPAPSVIGSRATPGASPSLAMSDASGSSVPRTTPTLNSSGLDTSGSSGDSNLSRAAQLIQKVDAMDKRVDRKSLTADDSQRDILAQKLLQGAKKALADRDSVAAISLATKASTLFEPLPRLAESAPLAP